MKLAFTLLGLSLVAFLVRFITPFFFMGPGDEKLAEYRGSSQFHEKALRFHNPVRRPEVEDRDSGWVVLMDFLFPPDGRTPPARLPEVPFDAAAMAEKSQALRFAWLGHSTLLVEMDGQRILVDPVFSAYASPIPIVARRFQPPAWPLDAIIASVDAVVISHNHYDHLDESSIKRLAEGPARFLTPLGVGQQLIEWGVEPDRVDELDWWQGKALGPVTLTATPAQHFSGRGLTDGNKTLWAGWAIKGSQGSAFFSGDTGYSPHFAQIGERLGPFSLTFLENGAYSKNWPFVHQLPEEAVQAHIDLRGDIMVPVHWGMFALGPHSWDEPARRVAAEADARGVNLISPTIGQLLTLDSELPRERWWERIARQ